LDANSLQSGSVLDAIQQGARLYPHYRFSPS